MFIAFLFKTIKLIDEIMIMIKDLVELPGVRKQRSQNVLNNIY